MIFVKITYSPVQLCSERITQKCIARLAPGSVRERHIYQTIRSTNDNNDTEPVCCKMNEAYILYYCILNSTSQGIAFTVAQSPEASRLRNGRVKHVISLAQVASDF